jgi:hypothetical protein
MKSLAGIALAVLLLVLAFVLVTPAEAYTTQLFPIGTTSADTWTRVNLAETTATATFTFGDYNRWGIRVAARVGNATRDTMSIVVQWRAKVSLLKAPTTYYYTPWKKIYGIDSVYIADTVFTGTPFKTETSPDSVIFFDEFQVRAYGATLNDTARIRADIIRLGNRF